MGLNSFWEYPECNLCGSSKVKVFYNSVKTWEYKEVFRIVKCIRCGLMYLYPRPNKKNIAKFYPQNTYWGMPAKEAKKVYRPIYKKIFKKFKTGAILDVGAGAGFFLTKFKDLGWDYSGIELSSHAARMAKRRGIENIEVGDFPEDFRTNQQFEVITFNNSLEHLYQPRQALIKAKKLLKNDGLIVICVPNFNSLGRIIFKSDWFPLQPPRHLYHFTLDTISLMLSKAGLKVTEVSYDYFEHNFYSLFQSFRYKFSPRFNSRSQENPAFQGGDELSSGMSSSFRGTPALLERGGRHKDSLTKKNIKSFSTNQSTMKFFGKIFANVFAFKVALLGSFLGRGEYFIVTAQKSN